MNLVRFDMSVGHGKPENIVQKENDCPFCRPETLTGILAAWPDGILLLKNKYNVLSDADQLVLVETARCGVDMPDYAKEHMRRLIRFGAAHWARMEKSGRYDAVLFFKNHGRFSGGTMRHAHMQLVGLRRVDPALFPREEEFQGVAVVERNGVLLNAATRPRLGFGEFNLVAVPDALDTLADLIQTTVAYICSRYQRSENSYNIFFYRLDGRIGVKLMPRFPTSPLLIGYDLRILPNNLKSVAEDFKRYMNQTLFT